MSHSENVVCRIDLAGGRRVAMRFHRPGYNSLQQMESEVLWVRALSEAGIPVPTAIPTVEGAHYVSVEVGSGTDLEERFVGVVDWVEGAPLGGPMEGAAGTVVDRFAAVGALMARVRVHNQSWAPPQGFERRRWDTDGLVGDNPLWGRFWEVETITSDQRRLFAAARAELRRELAALSTGPDRFGLIHSDLHLGNLMASGDELTLIDFDDSGFGWFAHEIAVALHPVLSEAWFDQARAELIDGYRTVHQIDEDEIALIDTFLVVRALMIVGWLDARPELEARRYFPYLVGAAEEMARAYLER